MLPAFRRPCALFISIALIGASLVGCWSILGGELAPSNGDDAGGSRDDAASDDYDAATGDHDVVSDGGGAPRDGGGTLDGRADTEVSDSHDARVPQTIHQTWTFEDAPDSGWFFGGNAGYDIGAGFAHTGQDNVWVNAITKGIWNSVNVSFDPGAAKWGGKVTTCDISAWIQTSPDFVGGIMDVWDHWGGTQLAHEPLPTSPSWQEQFYHIDVSASSGAGALLVFGFWGTGTDQWLRVDDVSLTCVNFGMP
jgi:hypothetical protein